MEIKEMNLIVKITGIVGAVFCGIALLIPWAGLGVGGFGIGIYPWGISTNIPGLLQDWDIFFINAMSSGVVQSIVSGICMIIAFVLTIIALILGIVGFKNVGIKKTNTFMTAGILSIVAIILCVVAVSQLGGSTPGFGLGYGAGFFLIIIAMILYFVSFGLQKAFAMSPAQPMYQQPMQIQAPAQYYAQPPQTPPQQPQVPPVQQTAPPPAQTGGKFCAECGAKLQPNVKFCPGCGAKL